MIGRTGHGLLRAIRELQMILSSFRSLESCSSLMDTSSCPGSLSCVGRGCRAQHGDGCGEDAPDARND